MRGCGHWISSCHAPGGWGRGCCISMAMVPKSVPRTMASTSRRVSDLCIGKSPFQRELRCAETRNFGRRNRWSRQSRRISDTAKAAHLCLACSLNPTDVPRSNIFATMDVRLCVVTDTKSPVSCMDLRFRDGCSRESYLRMVDIS
jgi:hypothetical protein